MSLFHEVKVKEIIRETPDAATIIFDIPPQLRNQFTYRPGQYTTVSVQVAGKEERRAYSFCTSPVVDADPAVTVKKVCDGVVSTLLNDSLKAGDTIKLMPPMGKFTADLNASNRKHYMLFAGGSGITPVMAILKSVLHTENESLVTLIYANRNEESIIFRKKLREMLEEYNGRMELILSLDEASAGWSGHTGRLGAADYRDMSTQHLRTGYDTEYFICGPSGMMDQVKQGLAMLQVSPEKIHTEYFATPVSPRPEATTVIASTDEQDEGGLQQAVILLNGKEFEITVSHGQTVLEAAKEQDLDPPYACQMGVCTTCRARMLEGEVKMDEREGLSDAEIAEGYVLTCQSHPVTKKIRLIYE